MSDRPSGAAPPRLVAVLGPTNTGKTHLATALAAEACARGKRVRFFRVTELATPLLEAREERQLTRLPSQRARPDLLVLENWVPCRRARSARSDAPT